MKKKSVQVEIEILSYWHAGSGIGRGAETDALVLKDRAGLPYLPGRTLKGLLREGMKTCEDAGIVEEGQADALFGKPSERGRPDGSKPGQLHVKSAKLPPSDHDWLASEEGKAFSGALFCTFSSTSIGENGIADDKTLRSIELCVPLTLEAEVHGPEGDWLSDMKKACSMIRGLGCHRSRGLGRCEIRIR